MPSRPSSSAFMSATNAAHRLARGAPHADHAAVMRRHHRRAASQGRVMAEPEQLLCPLADVDVGILLVGDERRRRLQHRRRDVAVEVELAAQHRVRACDRRAGGPAGRPRSRRSPPPPSRRACSRARGRAAARPSASRQDAGRDSPRRHGGSSAPPAGRRCRGPRRPRVPPPPRCVRQMCSGRVSGEGAWPGRIAVEVDGVPKSLLTRRQRREGVGLGPETGDEDPHGRYPPRFSPPRTSR